MHCQHEISIIYGGVANLALYIMMQLAIWNFIKLNSEFDYQAHGMVKGGAHIQLIAFQFEKSPSKG